MIQINLIVCAIAVNVLYSLALSLTLKFTNFLLKQHIALIVWNRLQAAIFNDDQGLYQHDIMEINIERHIATPQMPSLTSSQVPQET